MVIVVAGEEHDPAAGQALGDQVEESLRALDRVLDGREQEVEEVAEEDQLVDVVQVRREPLERVRVGEEVVAGPRSEMGVGDRQGAHPRAG